MAQAPPQRVEVFKAPCKTAEERGVKLTLGSTVTFRKAFQGISRYFKVLWEAD